MLNLMKLNHIKNISSFFNIYTEAYEASIPNPDKFDVLKIIHKLSSYITEEKSLPEIDCIACY